VECDVCHEARVSEVSSDVLLPKIDVCTQCHAGESARNKVPSTCITCHIFHRPELDLMMEPKKSAGAGHPFPMTTAGASSGSTVAGSTVAGSTLAGATVVGSGAAATTAGKEMVTR
jgi:predicted CXXCH cytochrome family protein